MKSASESLSPPGTSHGRAAGGNCVAARRGGEQPEADPRSQTQVNPIRLVTAASLRASGEACHRSGDRSDQHPSSTIRVRAVGGGGGGNAGKVSWGSVEICPGRIPPERDRAEVRAAIVVMKRGNSRGAKGGRKQNHGAEHIPYIGAMDCPRGLKRHGERASGRPTATVADRAPFQPRGGSWRCPGPGMPVPGEEARKSRAGKAATGEPDAGDPPVRFGGRGGTSQCPVPTPIQ